MVAVGQFLGDEAQGNEVHPRAAEFLGQGRPLKSQRSHLANQFAIHAAVLFPLPIFGQKA